MATGSAGSAGQKPAVGDVIRQGRYSHLKRDRLRLMNGDVMIRPNIKHIEDQLDRSYIWYLLYDHIDLLKVLPNEYLDCVISNIGIE